MSANEIANFRLSQEKGALLAIKLESLEMIPASLAKGSLGEIGATERVVAEHEPQFIGRSGRRRTW